MKKLGRLLIIISACAPFIAGCGLTGSSTQLPQLDRNTLAAVYNQKQKDAAIKSMSDLASKQKAEADKVFEPDAAKPVTTISVSHQASGAVHTPQLPHQNTGRTLLWGRI